MGVKVGATVGAVRGTFLGGLWAWFPAETHLRCAGSLGI